MLRFFVTVRRDTIPHGFVTKGQTMRWLLLEGALAAVLLAVVGTSAASAAEFTREVRELSQKYMRASGQCSLHAAPSPIGSRACSAAPVYAKALGEKGWDVQKARETLAGECRQRASANQLAAIYRDTGRTPADAFALIRQEKWIKASDAYLKQTVNVVYFERDLAGMSPMQILKGVQDACLYGPDPDWKPLQ
ncbi:hypothetical protein CEY09_30135 [Achromobacter marplatensis]|uniref:Lysozyme inhibitor LprI N-terminal domain-containing protein n=1 Tax=Achromobacter marplatensis TaxID=470868 RepID=A0ABX9FXU6_9BURK|nr:hypothetical protein CEY09_30135 [Achromobacter marplatensis]RBP11292.1 hypothetical protein DFP87_12353 [Achromobacter marplatensis]CAB3711875.1 hypothetical protein LMG26219_05971 [Achromobacter marplatensis]